MAGDAMVTLGGVTVLRESHTSLLCQIDERQHWIPLDKLRDGTTIAHAGDTGTLVVPRTFAVEWGLVPYDD
jgi:hypothetical protein